MKQPLVMDLLDRLLVMRALTPRPDTWSLAIFHVTSECRQQQVLAALADVAHTDVCALGVSRDSDWFVIVDSPSARQAACARLVILGVDARATRTLWTRDRRERV